MNFNLDRARDGAMSNVRTNLATIRDARITGPMQVALNLSVSDTGLPPILSDRSGMMVSPAALAERGPRHSREPAGSGLWKFVSSADNEKVIVTGNERY